MDFILRVVQSTAAKAVAVTVLLSAIVGGVFFVLIPRDTKFVIQTGGSRSSSAIPDIIPPPPESAPTPSTPSPPADLSPTALPDRTLVIVEIQQAGASAEQFAKIRELAHSLGYPVRTLPPASSSLEKSTISYPSGKRAVAERLAFDLRLSVQFVEVPQSDSLLLSLGKS